MDFDSPETWRWIWLVAVVAFTVGELAVAGSFFLAPFAVGALAAALVAFAGGGLGLEWAAFLVASVITFAGLRPIANRLQASSGDATVGAGRWVRREAVVVSDIGPGKGATGSVRLDREEWRAESLSGDPIPAGSTVLVARVEGTRLLVMPVSVPLPELPDLPNEGDA